MSSGLKSSISLFVQSTEDKDRILSSLAEVFSIPYIPHIAEFMELKGHHGNPVTHVNLSIKGDEARGILQTILERLSEADRDQLIGNLEDYLDERGNLYVRLDKQELCLKRLAMSQSDAVRIVVKPFRGELEELLGSEA